MHGKTKQGMKPWLWCTLLISMGLFTFANAADSEPSVTPYRPTVSNPADLSEPGWLELEMGAQRIEGGADHRRDSMPLLAKLAFTENWGILVGSELGIRRTDTSNQVLISRFSRVKGISGSSILGSGEVALILAVSSLIQHAIERENAALVAEQNQRLSTIRQ